MGCKPTPDQSDKSGRDEKPNIIFILADDLGWSDLPSYGNKFNEAPNIEKLAQNGMLFTDAYAACPVCSPTRASIMSGQYPARVGVIDFITGHWRPYEKVIVPRNRTQYLPLEITTMAEMLKTEGYATAMFGKWHLGGGEKFHPLNQGFDVANVGQGYFNIKFDPPREQSSEKIQMERITDFGIDFINQNKEKPFFLYLAHWSVHCLLDADQVIIDKYVNKPKVDGYTCNAVYAAVIEHLDNSIGRLVDEIEKLGLTDNTLIVFYSDNGGSISENRYPGIEEGLMPMIVPDKVDMYKDNPLRYMMTTNAPLRGEKGNLYEGGIREPLIVKWPGKIAAGTVNKSIVSSVDFYKTFLELSGAEEPLGQVLDGKSLVPQILNAEVDAERAVYWHYPVYHHGIPGSAIRKGDWKLIENLEEGGLELYNLYHDRSETTNMSEAFPEKTEELYTLLKAWREDVGAELPVPNPEFDEQKRYEWGTHPDR
ncbi:MAG: sulfatase [Bacteroidales bacterium]|nr:sulfatase [Bacteroidales bacterium]